LRKTGSEVAEVTCRPATGNNWQRSVTDRWETGSQRCRRHRANTLSSVGVSRLDWCSSSADVHPSAGALSYSTQH